MSDKFMQWTTISSRKTRALPETSIALGALCHEAWNAQRDSEYEGVEAQVKLMLFLRAEMERMYYEELDRVILYGEGTVPGLTGLLGNPDFSASKVGWYRVKQTAPVKPYVPPRYDYFVKETDGSDARGPQSLARREWDYLVRQ